MVEAQRDDVDIERIFDLAKRSTDILWEAAYLSEK
jgi:hypothetical protein